MEPFNPKQFSDRILYLLEHPVEAQEMGAKARKTVEQQLDWRIVVKDAMKVYDEALKLTDFYWFAPISHRYLLEQLNNIQRAKKHFR